MRETEREREVIASTVTAVCGEEGEQEVVVAVHLIVVTLLLWWISAVCGVRGFSQFGFSTLTSVFSLLLLFFVSLCINRLLGCGRAKQSESNAIT